MRNNFKNFFIKIKLLLIIPKLFKMYRFNNIVRLTKHTPFDLMYKMKRYQVYLNPHSVAVLDEIKKLTNIRRSKIIRDAVDKIATQIIASIPIKKPSKKHYIMDELVGFIDLKTKKKTNYAQHVDDIYFQD